MFRAIYESSWHSPVALWALATVLFAWLMRRRPFLTAWLALFTVEILADAWATGGLSPLKPPWSTPIAIAFVILGDFRYFLLVERFVRRPEAKPSDATAPSAWGTAVALAFVVPVVSSIGNRALEGRVTDTRWTFLTYELTFLVLALVLRFVILPRRLAGAGAPLRAWLLRVTTFEVAQYALWAAADVIILAGADVGFALRLVPNTMYYALFLPFVAWAAPKEIDP